MQINERVSEDFAMTFLAYIIGTATVKYFPRRWDKDKAGTEVMHPMSYILW